MTAPELAFGEAGHGTTVVLLHGFPLERSMWDEVTDGLAEDSHVVPIDLPGFGRSPLPADGTSLDDVADGVVSVLDALSVDTAVVVGLSMGGYVALAVAERHPQRLAGLALVNTKASADDDTAKAKRLDLAEAVQGPAGLRALRGMADTLVGAYSRAHRPDVLTAVEAMIARAEPAAVAWGARAMAERPDRHHVLEALDVPALVLTGEEDALMPLSAAQQMAESLGVEPVVLPQCGHLSAMESPEEVTEALRDLLRRTR